MLKTILPLTVASIIGFSSTLQANILLADNFETYVLNSVPTNPGDGNPANWYFQSGRFSKTAVEAADSNQYLHVVRSATSTFASYGRTFDKQSTGVVQIDFSMNFEDLTSSNSLFAVIDTPDITGTNYQNAFYLRLEKSGSLGFTEGNGGATGVPNTVWNSFTLNEDIWYDFSITVDLDRQKFSVRVTNRANPSQTSTVSDLNFINNVTGINAIYLRPRETATDNAMNTLLDNVEVKAIPEPAGLLGYAGVILLSYSLFRSRR